MTNRAPRSNQELLPQKTSDRTKYNVRSNDSLTIPKTRTTSFKESFIPDTTKDWNSLTAEARSSKTLENFTEYLPKPNQTPKHYYTGTRKVQILHVRLRLKCSSLNSHLADRGLTEDRACECGVENETVQHFLLECPLYQAQRDELFENLPFQNVTRPTKNIPQLRHSHM